MIAVELAEPFEDKSKQDKTLIITKMKLAAALALDPQMHFCVQARVLRHSYDCKNDFCLCLDL